MTVHHLPRGRIHVGDWREADLEPGYSLAIVDGPYGMGIAEWDRIKLDDLAGWYEPHVARLTSLMAPSASVYLWNTAAGWARLDPVMRAAGWTFRALVTWEKSNPPSQKGCEDMRTWPDVTEVCGFYQREGLAPLGGPAQFIAYAAGESDRNEIRKWLHAERARAGLKGDALEAAVNEAGGKGNMICRHSFTESQWCLPTFDQWKALHIAWNRRGDPAGRPYLQRDRSRVYNLADAADHEALRAEYEALRAPFSLPPGVTNVWSAPLVGGAERLRAPDGTALHACQKPLAWAERMVRASTRPGERVVVPFGGTCREAVVIEHMARFDPDEARSYDVCEKNEDEGKDYVGAALAQIRGEDIRRRTAGQLPMFGGAK